MFSEWMTHSLYILENPKFSEGIDTTAQKHQKAGERIRQLLWDTESEDAFLKERSPENHLYQEKTQGMMLDGFATGIEAARSFAHAQYDQAYLASYLPDILSRCYPQRWRDIIGMEMDEDDLNHYVQSKIPQAHRNDVQGDIKHAREELQRVMEECDFPAIYFDALTFESFSSLTKLTESLKATQQAYHSVGAPSVGLGKISLSICSPYLEEGHSGQMDNTFLKNGYLASVSNCCGWDYSEVITHEILHAHDAALGEHLDPGKKRKYKDLLSDYETPYENLSPLHKAWLELETKVDHLQGLKDLNDKKELCRKSIGKRWETMGVHPQNLEEIVRKWEQTNDPQKDQQFLESVQKLFLDTPFKESRDFRSQVILAECKIVSNMTEQTLFRDFTQQFDGLVELEEQSTYGKGYFENRAEKMARSFQLVLDTQNNTTMEDNPFAKRWLVYPEQNLAGDIAGLWKEFFDKTMVKEAYCDILRKTGVIKENEVAVSGLNKESLVKFKEKSKNDGVRHQSMTP